MAGPHKARRILLELVHQHIDQNNPLIFACEIADALQAGNVEEHRLTAVLELEREQVLIPEPHQPPTFTRRGRVRVIDVVRRDSGPGSWRIGPGAVDAATANRKHPGGKPRKRNTPAETLAIETKKQKPNLTLKDVCAIVQQEHPNVTLNTIRKALERERMRNNRSRKKAA